MIVVDSSVIVEALSADGQRTPLRARLVYEKLLAPDILPIEVASAIRGLNLGGKLADARVAVAASDLSRMRIGLHPSLPLIPRVLSLRRNFSAYDASYVALAEAFGCPLLTFDERLAKAARQHCAVEVVAEE